MTTKTARPVRRSRDRKAQILAAALECFHRSGYHATGMEDIAGAVGITAGGLYRHFRGKQELLSRVMLDGLDLLATALEEADGLDELLGAIAHFTLDHRSLPVLLDRETRNLGEEARASVLRHHDAHAGTIATAIRDLRPELDEDQALLLAWCALGVLVSPSYHSRDLPRPRFEDVLRRQASAVCRSRALPADVSDVTPQRPGTGLAHVSRREALLAAAIPLFKARGFQVVSMEDIGAAAGIAGPSIYNHFSSKAEILAAALHRESEVLRFSLARELSESRTPTEALHRVLRTYSSLCGTRTSAMPLMVGELVHLSAEQRQGAYQSQLGFVAECVGLLRTCRPELDEDEGRVMVGSVLSMVLMLYRLPSAIRRLATPDVVSALAMDSLGIGDRA
ncbi:TetR/AcrR family transcriptional regulator [Streptomyces sp. NPDC056503]|uniref:TetR/AcrR family transcriptional regulator n=1 Tax=Streptomyces sp. NPDC056503 TaxID=3345842 RepID=UPI0036A8B2F2